MEPYGLLVMDGTISVTLFLFTPIIKLGRARILFSITLIVFG